MAGRQPAKRVTLPRSEATAAALFADVEKPYTGQHCVACQSPKIAATVRETLQGMIGEGPAAGRVPLHLTIQEMFDRLTNPERCAAVGIPPYGATVSAFRKHINVCERELHQRVKAAKREAGCRY